jgi:RNA polymerase sigma factor (sigma-70 family)
MPLYPANDMLSQSFQAWLQENLQSSQAKDENEKSEEEQKFCSNPELFRCIKNISKKLAKKTGLDKEDLFQEAFYLLLKKPELLVHKDLSDEEHLGLIITCLKNGLIDFLKKNEFKYQETCLVTDMTGAMNQGTLSTTPNGVEETTAEETLVRKDQLQLYKDLEPLVLECFYELPPEDQRVLTLVYYDKCSVKELAAEINTSHKNAYKRKDKALTKLRKALKQKLLKTNSSLKDELILAY